MRGTRRQRASIAAAALAIAVIASACVPSAPPAAPAPAPAGPPACTGPGGPPDAASAAILNATNASRAGAGLAPLAWNPRLWCLASSWSSHLAAINALEHSDLNATLHSSDYATYRTLGENLLRGPVGMSGDSMHTAWMGSPAHAANVMSPTFNSFAVALTASNGQVFATENFGGRPRFRPTRRPRPAHPRSRQPPRQWVPSRWRSRARVLSALRRGRRSR